MSKNISTKISELMAQKNISVADIQKSTGLNKNTIYGIISGNSKNPAAQNLQLITRVLGVSLESILIDETRFNFDNLTDKQLQAFSDATVMTIKTIIKKNQSYHLELLLSLIIKVYQYSIKIDPPAIDERFIHWLIDNTD